MKKLLYLIFLGLFVFLNAQGITNTLGGNTADDKFIVENSDSEPGLVVNGVGNVGIGTTDPSYKLHVVGSYGIGVYSKVSGEEGTGVHGEASHYGGYFKAADVGVYAYASGSSGRGVYAYASGSDGRGVYSETSGSNGHAVWGNAFGIDARGVYGHAAGHYGRGVYGYASNWTGVNYGIHGKTESPNGWAGYFDGRGYFSENVGIGTETPGSKLSIVGLSEYSGNTAAITAGLTVGDLYRTGDLLKIVH